MQLSQDTYVNVNLLPILILSILLVKASKSGSQVNADEFKRSPSNSSESFNLNQADQNDLYLVGLFDIHQSNPRTPFKCGPIEIDSGENYSHRPMQNMEAFLWAIEQVNADKSLLPGVKLGSLVLDTCSSYLRTNQQMANLLHGVPSAGSQMPTARQMVAIVADNSDWRSVESVVSMSSAIGLTTFVTQTRSTKLTDLARRYTPTNQLDLSSTVRFSIRKPLSNSSEFRTQRRFRRELRTTTDLMQVRNQFEGLLNQLLVGKMATSPLAIEEPIDRVDNSSGLEEEVWQQQHGLLMVRMLLGNELLAESLASLIQQMNWDLVSVIYDDQPDLVDLHDELARQLFARNIQLALDEQIPSDSNEQTFDRILERLTKKSSLGARVVVSLVETGSARSLLEAIGRARSNIELNDSMKRHPGNLLWITTADREPFYAYVSQALGTISVSSSVSLVSSFKSYYDQLALQAHTKSNRWWPEYLKAILSKHRNSVGLLWNECIKWQEPQASPLLEKCHSLTLNSLAEFERQSSNTQSNKKDVKQNLKLVKHLASGWEHNGMDVINSVLSAANALEATRQALCPESRSGMCEKMRQLVVDSPETSDNKLPLVSELIYTELLRSTFQLLDGRMFNLDDFSSLGGQVEGKFKLFNLRYLQPNSIGFVKFGTFDQQDGLTLNASKAKHYPTDSFLDQVALERVNSRCQDESKCLISSSYDVMVKRPPSLNEQELPVGINSLFKLDHPLIDESSSGTGVGASNGSSQQVLSRVEDSYTRTMRSPSAINFNWTSLDATKKEQQASGKQTTYNLLVLLPLHQSSSAGCSEHLELDSSFQHLVAISYAQNLANNNDGIQLASKVIDYCQQANLAESELTRKLSESSLENKYVAVIDFDAQISERIDRVVREHNLLHLTVGWPTNSLSNSKQLMSKEQHHQKDTHLRVSVLPTKSNEIEAIVKLLSSMPHWRLVHLVYTDHHQKRDEFVRLANEANVCVSKLIWIPQVSDKLAEQQSQRLIQLDKTRKLFKNELHDYTINSSYSSDSSTQGLNSTRVIVILASEHEATNRLILEAATQSMLDHYVWLATHEWLSSIELPAERMAPSSDFDLADRLPRFLLATRPESYESHSFRHYFAGLTPAIHSPLPTDWFDEFWQQHFRCRLPISGSTQQATPIPLPLCRADQHLDPHQLVEDDRVHYVLQTVESLAQALRALNETEFSPSLLAVNFRNAFEKSRASLWRSSAHLALAKLPYGFHIVHRLMPSQADIKSLRRQNSRDLNAASGQLVRIGIWRDRQLVLMRKKSNDTSQQPLLPGFNSNDAEDHELAGKIARSIGKLEKIKSRCSLPSTCQICKHQIQRTIASIKEEEDKARQSESISEPQTFNSIWTLAPPTLNDPFLPETLVDESLDDDKDELTEANTSFTTRDDLQVSASSLFEDSVGKQIEKQRQMDARREHSHMMRLHGQQQAAFSSSQTRFSSLLMSGLSLLGILSVLASMTYFYPNMIESRDTFDESVTMDNKQLSARNSSLASFNDYFLLTGLLMLYAINVAFLLPATMSVCWFRRIGLAMSYTVVLSSILVQVLVNFSRSRRQRILAVTMLPPVRQQQRLADPLEESVEVTFESLTHDQSIEDQTQPSLQENNSGHQKNSTDSSGNERNVHTYPVSSPYEAPTMLTVSLSLILLQVIISLIWFIRQPPEPTLYLSSWRCASPSRSPILFLYEPLISLIYPGLILVFTWILTMLSYKKVSRTRSQYRSATKRLLGGQVNVDHQSHLKLQLLDQKLGDAKSLVMSTTLLIIVWSVLTFNMISSRQNPQHQIQPVHLVSYSEAMKADESTLVYANIISSAIIFSFLFVYRLNLLRFSGLCFWPRSSSKFSGSMSVFHSDGITGQRNVLKFNQPRELRRKWFSDDSNLIGFFNGSQFSANNSHQERLRLQQFSSYGTYSNTITQPEVYHTSTTINPLSMHQIGSEYTSSNLTNDVEIKTHIKQQNKTNSKARKRSSPEFFFRLSSGNKQPSHKQQQSTIQESKLQRRQSSGSVASSTAKLVGDNSSIDNDMFMDDTMSCASSVASSSTSQLHGNDLYPIDCSIQLESQVPNIDGQANPMNLVSRSASMSRRSLRQSVNKLKVVREEPQVIYNPPSPKPQ